MQRLHSVRAGEASATVWLDGWAVSVGRGLSDLTVRHRESDRDLWARLEITAADRRPESSGDMLCIRPERHRSLAADEGPERCGLRSHLTLETGERESYCGDALEELTVLPDGTLFLGLGVRVLPVENGAVLRSIGWSIYADGRLLRAVAGAPVPRSPGTTPIAEAGEWTILEAGGCFLGLYWGRDPKGWCDPLGGEGLWPKIGDGKTAPFFHGWENYLRQWHEPRGWRARESAALVVDDESVALAWHQGSDLPLEGATHFTGAVALAWGRDEAEVRARMEALAAPLTPAAEGAAVTGFDYLEGSYRFRRTGPRAKITLPADPLARRALVRVDGPPAAAVSCSVNGKPVRPQLVSVGRVDDPYGPHEGRPDSNGRPVLAAFEKPAERVELGLALSKDAPTVVEVGQSEGASLSYLSQDDRRELLLFSHLDGKPLGRLSLADLKLRDLRLPGRERVAAAILPMYWFLMNAPSRFHSANLLEGWELEANGPGELRFSLSATNPGSAVRSTFRVRIPAPEQGRVFIDVEAGLEVLGDFAVPHFQFCNLFPEPSRMPGDWSHAETLAATRDALWVVENRKAAGGASTAEGERFRDFRAPFFLSQYASPAGNFALLVTSTSPEEQPLGYELCRCWLDNHLFASFPPAGPAAGTSYRASYQLALWGDERTSRDQVREVARASLDAGRLEI